ncbi:cytochrome c biogenesis CcdA family protein [Sphingomonas sp. RB56-2]|uniref:Cytochrome c biogenesis CcdA family protein n=1 Tax=Sphingomonas brevis TaxID=2908206 RepID=A0ABT0SAJ6_9SPHN|nr:cytochrome c biogenesis CcdA family protein [Sphingomonas brevis]MCL6741431.1 cytochrome c biogenesis CcdA family protein [Sphingomonas brevis]
MSGEVFNPLLAFVAGALTILSPCVLPLVPVVLASAGQQHRFGALALAVGLIASFTIVGFIVAAFGTRLGVDADHLRASGALILGAAGIFLIIPGLQDLVAKLASPLVAWAGDRQQAFDNGGIWGQAAIGVLLGLVWSPCVGPTLGAAIALAAQGQQLSSVALTMASFATGIAAVLLSIALLGRSLFQRMRHGLAANAKIAKKALGVILLVVSILILSGLDRIIEARFVQAAPDWLVQLTTSI